MKQIQLLDRRFGQLLERFTRAVTRLKFKGICELTCMEKIDSQRYKGVYLIEIRVHPRDSDLERWMTRFRKQWDNPRYRRAFTNTTKEKRIAKHQRLRRWMPLYIGKSRCVGKRVREHIELPMRARTTAMKLRDRGRFFARNRFRLKTIEIESKYYDVWVPMVERAMRDKFNPIVGRQ